jgi:hypothetical protein
MLVDKGIEVSTLIRLSCEQHMLNRIEACDEGDLRAAARATDNGVVFLVICKGQICAGNTTPQRAAEATHRAILQYGSSEWERSGVVAWFEVQP